MGVTVAEGTEEVGVLDLLPVLLGVAANESDSDPSSFVGSGGMLWGHGNQRQKRQMRVMQWSQGRVFLPRTPERLFMSVGVGVNYDFIYNKRLD